MRRTTVDVRRRIWRGYADGRRRIMSGRPIRPTIGGASPRRDQETWHRRSADGFDRYRAEHPPVRARVAIVCVSMRPDFVGAVARNVIRQVDVDLEFVFVANSPGFDLMDLDAHFRAISRPTVVRADAGTSLGRALNLGMSTTDARFVAKFDDDDRYGPHHLVDSLRAHGFARSGVVGKHTYYAEIESTGERVIRFPANEFRYTSTLAGGTLVIDRERVGDLAFDDRSIGEDRAFIDACHRRGISTYSADRFNFLQRRGADNTWNVPAESFLIGCESISVDEPAHLVDR